MIIGEIIKAAAFSACRGTLDASPSLGVEGNALIAQSRSRSDSVQPTPRFQGKSPAFSVHSRERQIAVYRKQRRRL